MASEAFRNSGCRFDHCILVNANKGIILDPAGTFVIRLCPDSLRMCAGLDLNNLELAEARQIVKQNKM